MKSCLLIPSHRFLYNIFLAVIASRDEPVGENNAPEEYAFDLIALAAVSDYDSLPSSGGSRLDVSTSNLAKPASWRRAPPKPPGRA